MFRSVLTIVGFFVLAGELVVAVFPGGGGGGRVGEEEEVISSSFIFIFYHETVPCFSIVHKHTTRNKSCDLAELPNVPLLKQISDRGYFLCHTIGCMIANSQDSPKQDQVISVWFLFVHRRSCQRRYLEKEEKKKRYQIKRFGFVSFFSIFICLRLVDIVF